MKMADCSSDCFSEKNVVLFLKGFARPHLIDDLDL
jgi:hypothetical protein